MNKMKKTKEKIVYESDASQIKGNVIKVYLPTTIAEIKAIINLNDNVVPRGGGTGLAGGAVPLNSVIIDLSKLNKIISLDLKKKIVEVEAGIILEDLNNELARYNLEFPMNPSSAKACTIGGMIATNAVGTRAVKYGRTSDWVKEFELVNGKSELVKINKLDFSEVLGMEGITGIIVKAKLNLINLKKRTATLVKTNEIEKIPEIVRKLKARDDVSMIELFDRLTSRYLGLPEIYHILVEFESDAGEFKGIEYEKIMELRNNIYPKLAMEGFSHIEDPKILPFKFPQFAKFLEERGVPFFGHVSEGIMHPCFKPELGGMIDEMLNFVKKMNGMITGEHGIGLLKKKYVEESDKKLIMRIKKRYDPNFKINPGKIIDSEKTESSEPSGEQQEGKQDEKQKVQFVEPVTEFNPALKKYVVDIEKTAELIKEAEIEKSTKENAESKEESKEGENQK